MFTFAVVPLALAASVLANVFLTSPVGTTTFTAGQTATVSWQDSGSAPSLAQFGNATFAIYVGNAIEQTPLQTIATYINVSTVNSVSFTPLAVIGPNSNEYFIRVTSQTLMNPSSPQYPEEAFSAKFTLAGMTGTFNSSVQAEINGQSTAPIGGPTGSASMTMATGTGTSAPTITTGTGSPATASPSSSSSSGAGKPVMATGLVVLVATLIGASFL
ncbi:hypothetical protein OG21DRAFT_1404714 [Imleria badia]|nr:hypothetical protein OG21DRAFT_1404714 [Imleria badia]